MASETPTNTQIMLQEGISLAANRLRTALGDTPQDRRATLGQLLQLVERVAQRLSSASSQPGQVMSDPAEPTTDEPALITKANQIAHAYFGTTFARYTPNAWRSGALTGGGAVMLKDMLTKEDGLRPIVASWDGAFVIELHL